jgi:hypothetical protein
MEMKDFYLHSRKAASQMISVYWIAILLLVAASIYGMVYAYYSHPYDIRVSEAEILNSKVIDCLSQKGRLTPEIVFNENGVENFDILQKCKLNFGSEDAFDWKDTPQYFVEVNFYDVGKKSIGQLKAGNDVWKKYCDIQEDESYSRLAKCVTTRFYALGKENKQILGEVTGVIRKTEKNVKL